MPFSQESFCPELWSQLEIDAQGDYKICCLANYDKDFGMALDDHGRVMNVLTHSFEDAINSKTHREHRLQLRDNIKVQRCRNCYDQEKSTKGIPDWDQETTTTGHSKRQFVTMLSKHIPEYVNVNSASQFTTPDGIVNSKIVNLDIRFGNLCNQKCVMCSPQHSNQWYEDWIAVSSNGPELHNRADGVYKKGQSKIYPIKKDVNNKYIMEGFNSWWESDVWWQRFEKASSDLRHIYFTGGEPMIVPAMQECLDRLISSGNAKNIILRYDTNLSAINKKIIDKWQHFRKILLCISLDETDDRYNLIRFPGDFKKFKRNIEFIVQQGIPIRYFSGCIGIASIYSMQRVIEFSRKYNTNSFFRFLEHPAWLDLRYLPPAAKLEIVNNLQSSNDGPEYSRWYTSQINLLNTYLEEEDQSMISEFVRVMNILDKQRNTNWIDILPDVYDVISRHCKKV